MFQRDDQERKIISTRGHNMPFRVRHLRAAIREKNAEFVTRNDKDGHVDLPLDHGLA